MFQGLETLCRPKAQLRSPALHRFQWVKNRGWIFQAEGKLGKCLASRALACYCQRGLDARRRKKQISFCFTQRVVELERELIGLRGESEQNGKENNLYRVIMRLRSVFRNGSVSQTVEKTARKNGKGWKVHFVEASKGVAIFRSKIENPPPYIETPR